MMKRGGVSSGEPTGRLPKAPSGPAPGVSVKTRTVRSVTGIDGEPDLIISLGDCEFYGECGGCGISLGVTRPDQSFDILGLAWEHHVMDHVCWEESS